MSLQDWRMLKKKSAVLQKSIEKQVGVELYQILMSFIIAIFRVMTLSEN
ncbi:hypothetical protein EZS27_025203 [termite gut metagenome]|uniref:Uncharacterized protein n=1 Tax=termite gut metagenome TaxID=433724 RepID=A0A5J4QW95_9ZZZZ